ncbi:hypothetical protein V7S43_018601 [Phytophthora oleae]|uniref:Uncharacterized protein n=1 Tax=Phytophthora oleae TaxID=2107226 RepID=A0ABD3EQP3_9STRA
MSARLRLGYQSLHLTMELTFAHEVDKLDTKVPLIEDVKQQIFLTECVALLG